MIAILRNRGTDLSIISESQVIENGLVKLPVEHINKFWIASEFLDFGGFFERILITNEIHKVEFGQFA